MSKLNFSTKKCLPSHVCISTDSRNSAHVFNVNTLCSRPLLCGTSTDRSALPRHKAHEERIDWIKAGNIEPILFGSMKLSRKLDYFLWFSREHQVALGLCRSKRLAVQSNSDNIFETDICGWNLLFQVHWLRAWLLALCSLFVHQHNKKLQSWNTTS